MYDPTVGRFISEDPTGFAAGDANLFRYCGNNPTNLTDPSGLSGGSGGSSGGGGWAGNVGVSYSQERYGGVYVPESRGGFVPEGAAQPIIGGTIDIAFNGDSPEGGDNKGGDVHEKYKGTEVKRIDDLKENGRKLANVAKDRKDKLKKAAKGMEGKIERGGVILEDANGKTKIIEETNSVPGDDEFHVTFWQETPGSKRLLPKGAEEGKLLEVDKVVISNVLTDLDKDWPVIGNWHTHEADTSVSDPSDVDTDSSHTSHVPSIVIQYLPPKHRSTETGRFHVWIIDENGDYCPLDDWE